MEKSEETPLNDDIDDCVSSGEEGGGGGGGRKRKYLSKLAQSEQE